MVLQHEQMVIDAVVRRGIVDSATIRGLMLDLVDRIGMKLLQPDGRGSWTNPNATYCDIPGNRGVTCSALIETSHIALHVWDEPKPPRFHLDLYSCSRLDPEQVFAWMSDYFEPIRAHGYFISRDNYYEDEGLVHPRIIIDREIIKVW